MAKADQVIWFEVLGKDAGKLRSFYGEMFNWSFDLAPSPDMDYGMTAKDDTGIGGGVGKSPNGAGWVTFYVGVKDVEAAIERAEKLGGKVLMPPTEIKDGLIAVVSDPEGHPVGLARA